MFRWDYCVYMLHWKNNSFFFPVQNLSFNLNFENGFGSWTHAENTTTKWQLHQGATQTPETGPSVDHTFGNKTGKYMYFESSYPRLKGDNAMLISPTILVPATCVRMYFHMLGKRIGKRFIFRSFISRWRFLKTDLRQFMSQVTRKNSN